MSQHIPYIQQMYIIIWLFFIKLYILNIKHARDHMRVNQNYPCRSIIAKLYFHVYVFTYHHLRAQYLIPIF